LELDAEYEQIHRLWDELSEFGAGDWETALTHMLQRLSELIPASNAAWMAAVRISVDAPPEDPLRGWRPRTMRLLRPELAIDASLKAGVNRLKRGEVDVTTIRSMQEAGSFRVYKLSELASEDWFHSHFYNALYESSGKRDALYSFVPVNSYAEAVISLFRDSSLPLFTNREKELAGYALRSLKWFHRRVLLGHGLMLAHMPLTETERRVLRALLGGGSEKLIASELGMSFSATHEHVANIYKKFAINSRAELMALWLGKCVES
jgi:DNA-binding CsgD family transcriptional regulator